MDMNALFRKRIGISQNEAITFEMLDDVLEKTAFAMPFENLRIIEKNTRDVTKDHLMNKILLQNEGGLCYELNTVLYFFLKENGFDVSIFRGVIFNNEAQDWTSIGRTHVTILLTHDEQTYLIDTGFGSNLPLRLVPLNGEVVRSGNGEFRVNHAESVYGDYKLELKLKHKDQDWRIGYTFDSHQPIQDVSEFNEIQDIIIENPKSPFNKNPLITRLTNKGNVTLTDTSLTQWIDGKVEKEEIEKEQFTELAKQHFGLNI